MSNIVVYTDGAFSPIREQGGVGVVILENNKKILEYSNAYKHCSNNKMELGAIIIALRFIKTPVDSIIVYSDSMYCIGCISLGWKRKKNKLMWKEFDKQFERVKQLCPNIKFEHVKGHSDNYWNNRCDEIAVKASQLLCD